MEEMARFREYLEANNLKLTPQRERILTTFMSQSGPISAEELLAALNEPKNDISISTLYRTLMHLQCSGLARRIQQKSGAALYEAVHGHSCQLICEKCGRRVPVSNPYLESMRVVAAHQEGFILHRCYAQFYGLCPSCAARDTRSEKLPLAKKKAKMF